jgi:putative heme-binding domain-containing protein
MQRGVGVSWRNQILGAFAILLSVTCGDLAYSSDPVQWIWSSSNRETEYTVVFRRQFDATKWINARLDFVTDFCEVVVEIDGKKIAEGYPYQTRHSIDLSNTLKSDTGTPPIRTIQIRATPTGGPAAIAARLTWNDTAGKPNEISSDANWKYLIIDNAKTEPIWLEAREIGAVEDTIWDPDEGRVLISRFDDYAQWKQALGQEGTDAPIYEVRDGFEFTRVRAAKEDEGSWVSLTFDEKGRAIIAREDQGLLRLSIPDLKMESVNDNLKECRGLQFVGKSLYAHANNSKALYRLRDKDQNGTFEDVEKLYEIPGGVGHGRNDLVAAPHDSIYANSIYAIHGDSVDIPRDAVDLTSPFREHRHGKTSREGFVLNVGPDGNKRQLITAGLRNPYGIALNKFGDAFTYDADAEYDMGAPWYRPTRMNHLLAGGDYGWRGVTRSWPSYYPDQPDFAPPTLDIGKGSPTAVAFGSGSKFPQRYRDALFILDWAYGRVLAIHMTPRGTSYTCRAENFLKGRPLNVTDIAFGPDGAMYITTGGRKTKSALYRVRYVGPEGDPPALSKQALARNRHAEEQRQLRKQLVAMLATPKQASLKEVWQLQQHADPNIRYLARCVVERQPVEQWRKLALVEPNIAIAMSGLLALARSDDPPTAEIIAKVCAFDVADRRIETQIEAARIVDLCLKQSADISDSQRANLLEVFNPLYPAGNFAVDRPLSLLLTQLDAPDFVQKTLSALKRAKSQRMRMQLLYALRNHKHNWTDAEREYYFSNLQAMDSFRGGEGMPTFINKIREDAVASLPPELRPAFKAKLKNSNSTLHTELVQALGQRPIVKKWTTGELSKQVKQFNRTPKFTGGKKVFRTALCVVCHRVGIEGGVTGPDLTSAGRRFGTDDLLASVVEPSKVVAAQYRGVRVETVAGKIYSGRLAADGDFRETEIRLLIDPLQLDKITTIAKTDVEHFSETTNSPMPTGLLDRFTKEEIHDLLAYIESGGDRNHAIFKSD